ncbi:magnesium transporter CorA family protein [Roseococcus suduntuyensis]|uniref:Magnesium transport protein CorA n=1 Tax=Roseococcus suduntuyensis TaxID=455361 RepID=A0A840AAA0_9PROT|nr:magnesium transporter CorA family protein [Roseococcus suduntuyensis]MBB3897214.1 magnesium transporter [Roseococcus suduntuyensis]
MLTTFAVRDGSLLRGEKAAPLSGAVWIDLLDPTPEEERLVEAAVGFELPSREEMQEIESSSRMYREGDVLFLTANFLHGVEGSDYESTPISFVLAPSVLVTVRHATPKAFSVFTARCQKTPEALLGSPDAVLLHLFGQIVDRLADILERIGLDIDRANQDAFRAARSAKKVTQKDQDLRSVLLTLGLVGDLTARTTDTLLGLTRILTFMTAEKSAVRKENQHLIKTLVRDVRSLVEHGNSMNHKATFLLDAVLGIINVEQMNIIKTFTVVSVALMPPTLIASIYGMNFQHMPELEWPIGYPLALLAMVLSALGPVLYFKRKGWL